MKRMMIFVLLTSLFGFDVMAEGGCPPGYYPHNVPGVQGCAPIPGYYQAQNWVDAYGTVVWWNMDDGSPRYAYSSKYGDRKSSEEAAIKQCEIAGGSDCSVAFTAVNSFIAVAKDDIGELSAISDKSERDVQAKLMKDCVTRGRQCEVIAIIDSRGWYE